VTSETFTGNLGGRDGADASCNRLAKAANLEGTFRAYLSTDSEDAITRISGARGWVRTDGLAVADTADDIKASKMFRPIRFDETGKAVTTFEVWTATNNGIKFTTPPASYGTCAGWTTETPTVPNMPDVHPAALVGDAGHSGTVMSFVRAFACTTRARLYCFQVDHNNPMPVEPAPNARLAFVSTSTFTPGTGGLTAADDLCKRDAAAANRPGVFKAALATAGASAKSRFLASDGPWKRLDGALLAPTTEALFDDNREMDAALEIDATGVFRSSDGIYLGARGFSTAGTDAASTCANWTVADTALTPGRRAASARKDSFGVSCGSPRRLMCLETSAAP